MGGEGRGRCRIGMPRHPNYKDKIIEYLFTTGNELANEPNSVK